MGQIIQRDYEATICGWNLQYHIEAIDDAIRINGLILTQVDLVPILHNTRKSTVFHVDNLVWNWIEVHEWQDDVRQYSVTAEHQVIPERRRFFINVRPHWFLMAHEENVEARLEEIAREVIGDLFDQVKDVLRRSQS